MLNVVKNKKIFFTIPAVIIVLGVIFYFVHGGFNLDVDFTGGTNLQLDLGQQFEVKDIVDLVKGVVADANPSIVRGGETGTEVTIKLKELTDEQSTEVLNAIREKYDPSYKAGEDVVVEDEKAQEGEDAAAAEEKTESKFKVYSRDTISATIGGELRRSAFLSAIIAILLMLVYISFRFEFWSGIASIVALTHDVLVVLSIYAIFNLPMNTTFIAAILTIVGYSINATIVVFDRVRENNRFAKKTPFSEVINKSVSQSITRTINTSITTLLSILTLFILGVSSIKQFSLPIIIGILVGAYSSITIASPVWFVLKGGDNKPAK